MILSFLQLVTIFEAIAGGIMVSIIFSFLSFKISRHVGLLDIQGSATHKQDSWSTRSTRVISSV